MQEIGKLVTGLVGRAKEKPLQTVQSRAPAQQPQPLNLSADRDIPNRVWSNWIPADGHRSVKRELSPSERHLIEQRRKELVEGLAPFSGEEVSRVEIALNAMFAGYRSMRQIDATGEAIVEVTRAVLREFPAWAIETACVRIARNEVGLDPKWPPNDAQIHEVVAGIVKPYQEALNTSQALLAAPVERPDPPKPRKTYEQIRAEFAEHGFYLGGGKPVKGENADVLLQKYGVSREDYDAIPDLPKDHEYWSGKRKTGE